MCGSCNAKGLLIEQGGDLPALTAALPLHSLPCANKRCPGVVCVIPAICALDEGSAVPSLIAGSGM